jgi:pyruvate/2-oxoglutarate/acetoin dehydrogenase E1 component/TPP-dependent pyruvate/acetoin dehydrogenase alpha subunit
MVDKFSTREKVIKTGHTKESVLSDFRICCISRELSLLIRKEVLTGKAKFGVSADGKEVPQVALARVFKKGDWRSGYYRDQTMMLALDMATPETILAQLYADTYNDPFSKGRQMNSHFATPMVKPETGEWVDQTLQYNSAADVSCTAGQMAKALGLAFASKKFKTVENLDKNKFSNNGNEVCFVTIGEASTSEGVFWETLNAAAVLQVPMAVSVWDDGYGISVPVTLQTAKASISEALAGLQAEENQHGIQIYTAKAWDYASLVEIYQQGIDIVRENQQPALFHIQECTQPQGHSTSGSHERYKSPERLAWEKEMDCIASMEKWMLDNGFATPQEINHIREEAKFEVKKAKESAWKKSREPFNKELASLENILRELASFSPEAEISLKHLKSLLFPSMGELLHVAKNLRNNTLRLPQENLLPLKNWISHIENWANQTFHTDIFSSSPFAALKVPVIPAIYSEHPAYHPGHEILNIYFDKALENYKNLFAFGEDLGKIGDVNQGFAGLQKKYGEDRVFDTGIREWTIMGQAIGMSMRGLKTIAEIQYIDYLLYGLQPLSDDLATLRYRSGGIQQAPAVIRTRGHRLEGIWHSGSPMGMIISSLRGMYVLTPRNMTQAAGMYATMLQSDDPAIMIECLNGYRLKEALPENIGTFTVPIGVPEILKNGSDLTLVTYGSCVRIAEVACQELEKHGISSELIDLQTLLPFDIGQMIKTSLQKTNVLVVLDEDVPGGASSFILQQILEIQQGYQYLDAAPLTITAREHRPPYGSDGDYFSKPNAEEVFEKIYHLVREQHPSKYPEL